MKTETDFQLATETNSNARTGTYKRADEVCKKVTFSAKFQEECLTNIL